MHAANRDGSDESFHEWRKRTKDLRYGIELLARAWPETMQPMAESAKHLTDLLGNDHDLAVLQAIVENELKEKVPEPEREMLKPLAAQRRSDLQKEGASWAASSTPKTPTNSLTASTVIGKPGGRARFVAIFAPAGAKDCSHG